MLPKSIKRRAGDRHRRAGFGVPDARGAKGTCSPRDAALREERGSRPARSPRRRTAARSCRRSRCWRGVPGRPGRHRHDARADGAGRRPWWCRRASGASSTRRSTASRSPRCIRFYNASVREFEAAGRTVGAARRSATTAPRPGVQAIGTAAGVAQAKIDAAKEPHPARDPRGALAAHADQGRIHAVRLRGLRAAGRAAADRERPRTWRYVGSACPRTPWSDAAGSGSRPAACTCSSARRSSRTSPRCTSSGPTSRSHTTPVVQAAKQRSTPSLYFTNLSRRAR